MKKIDFILIIVFILISSCSMFGTSESNNYKKSTVIDFSSFDLKDKNWSPLKNEGSDFALHNLKTQSIFLINSACRKFESSSLHNLSSSIFTGIEDLSLITKTQKTYFEREAFEIEAKGKLDGVTRFFRVVTVQKNSCIYDFILIATKEKNLEKDKDAFYNFLNRIKID